MIKRKYINQSLKMSSAGLYCSSVQTNGSIARTIEQANSGNNGAREIEFGSLDGGDNGENNVVDFVMICKIFSTQDNVFHEAVPFDRVYLVWRIHDHSVFADRGRPHNLEVWSF